MATDRPSAVGSPAASAPHGPAGGDSPPRLAARADVLVVEQEPGLAQAIALYLSAAGVRARVATDGLAGLHELQREAPDLVVLDLAAPVVSGFRLLHLLKRDAATRHVPVLVLSGVTFQEAREAAVGADDFLEKPVGPREVVARARRLLDLAARTRAARPDRRARTG